MSSGIGYLYIALTIAFTVYGQIVLKWQVGLAGAMPEGAAARLMFLMGLLSNLWVVSAFAGALLASISWMAAMTKFQLSYAYPFMSLNFVFVLGLSAWLFHESVTMPKLIGVVVIVLGIVISSRG